MAIDLVRRCTVFVAAALTAAAAIVAPVAVPSMSSGLPAASAACPDIEVVFARGTNDTPGLGRIGNAFVSSLRNKVGGRSVGAYAVNYPASYDFLAAAGGANDASGHIQWMVDNCPDTRLVLGGYSQGAAVIDVIAAVPFPAVGFTAPLPPNVPEHVAAVAVFGNPSAKLGLPLTASPVYGSRAIDLCNPGDPVCGDGDSVPAHRAYEGPANDAANFVAGLL
ncbi:cutinase [Mycolicibacterium conceptionense]|uniref:Cutinase n=5 Tax=Mycolicibacterium TaxID=1866885 RepID=A0A0J8UAB3_9MYCO|nr:MULTISPECIES: cutinase family protein [Mycolicibacterium]KLI09605.1 cutinase [Mycolicibacterium senegalense]KLO51755.1 cutinase [Mycolicibacterium senegalense]KMV17305.1 cutinase [Mycolicibacterium conceptionense]MCW1819930.1 cutinase family protein [Mycolicibacterium senegalense]OBB06592.1 cutinase [Mycolicibacterium conceptionense]